MQVYKDELYHHGIKGMKWGVRRYQNPDGTLTAAGKKKYGDPDRKLTSYQKTMYRMDYGVKGANRIEKDYSKGMDKKTAVEREKKRIARGKAVSRAVASVYVYDYLTGGKVSSAAKNAAKHAVARALTNMAAEKAYKNETRGRMYAQHTEV